MYISVCVCVCMYNSSIFQNIIKGTLVCSQDSITGFRFVLLPGTNGQYVYNNSFQDTRYKATKESASWSTKKQGES